jgi:hypothetical protein
MLAGGIVLSGATDPIRFTDVTREAGIDFLHTNGSSPDKHLVETMGSGGLFFDYDNDGWIDIFLVDGGSLADPALARKARHHLYRNRGPSTGSGQAVQFEDVTARSNIRHAGYGMGACAGDVDNDGWIDLYVTGFGGNALYRNRGDGTFVDITQSSGVGPREGGSPPWSASCAFADLDKDGDLDLFVTNYVELDPRRPPFCGNAKLGIRSYCHPLSFSPLPNTLYRRRQRPVRCRRLSRQQPRRRRHRLRRRLVAGHLRRQRQRPQLPVSQHTRPPFRGGRARRRRRRRD